VDREKHCIGEAVNKLYTVCATQDCVLRTVSRFFERRRQLSGL
jgi:hypothetical protein